MDKVLEEQIRKELLDGTLVKPGVWHPMNWIEAGMARAACEHGCAVDLDGWCVHGRPSWLLVFNVRW